MQTGGGLNMTTGSLGSVERMKLANPKDASKEVARHLTSFFMKQLVDQMWKTVPEGSLIPQSNGEKIFRSFFNEQLTGGLARALPIGEVGAHKSGNFARPGVRNRPPVADIQNEGGSHERELEFIA